MTKNNEHHIAEREFAKHIIDGLTSSPKRLSSKYFYDENGDRLFEQIMNLPEYYLTSAEFDIISQADYPAYLKKQTDALEVIELGAGNGYKTVVLLERLLQQGIDVNYKPIDISKNALTLNESYISSRIPALHIEPMQGDYFDVLSSLQSGNDTRKLIIFLGSNLGNFSHPQARSFLHTLSDQLHVGDYLLLGLDLKKNPEVVLRAYNDNSGVTAAFNFNILHRINKTFNADFKIDHWIHYPVYNPESGTTKSYLVSTRQQEVYISDLDFRVSFKSWETIHTEISQKYTDSMLKDIIHNSGLQMVNKMEHPDILFADYLLQKG